MDPKRTMPYRRGPRGWGCGGTGAWGDGTDVWTFGGSFAHSFICLDPLCSIGHCPLQVRSPKRGENLVDLAVNAKPNKEEGRSGKVEGGASHGGYGGSE